MHNNYSYISIVSSLDTRAQHTPFASIPVGCLDKEDSGIWQRERGRSR